MEHKIDKIMDNNFYEFDNARREFMKIIIALNLKAYASK